MTHTQIYRFELTFFSFSYVFLILDTLSLKHHNILSNFKLKVSKLVGSKEREIHE
jgi:hypothetical protein